MAMTDVPDYMTPRLHTWRRYTDVPLVILAIGSLPILALELMRDQLIRLDRDFLDAMNIAVLIAFAVDYFVELALAQHRKSFVRHELAALGLVFTQALAVIPALSAFGVFRIARAGRAARLLVMLLRLVAVGGLVRREGRAILRRHAAAFAFGLAGFTWITSAVLFTIVEDVGRGEEVHSFFDALWWSLGAITTVGSELHPHTGEGRVIGGFTMLVGLSTFGILTAKVAEFLVRGDLEPATRPDSSRRS
jgi:voltage-gated potassium channel